MATKSKSRYMKTGNIADNRVGLAPNPEEKPKVVKKPLAKKATANAKPTPKKPSPPKNKPLPAQNASKKAKTPAKFVAKKKTTAKANTTPNAKTKNNAPKYPTNQALSGNNMEDLFKLKGEPGLSRLEFQRQMK